MRSKRRGSAADAVRARRTRMMVKKWRGYAPTRALRTQRVEIVDGAGKLRAIFGTGGPMGNGAHLAVVGVEGGSSTSLGLHEDGQAYVAVSGGKGGRGIKMAVGPEDAARLVATGENSPLLYLGLDEEEGGEPVSYLVLADKDGQASVAITGRKSGSFLRISDVRGEVRASLEVGADGEPELNRVDREGYPYGPKGWLYRTLNESGTVYRVVVAAAFLLASVVVGAWIAGLATSAAGVVATGSGAFLFGAIGAGVFLVVVIASLLLTLIRNRG